MDPLFYKIVRPIIKFLFVLVYRPSIVGRENIPTSGRVVLAGNHTNNFDCLLLISSTKRVIHFLGKHTLFKGLGKYIFKGMGVIPVDRTKPRNKEALEEAERVLEKNLVIGIFPEATTNKTSDVILPFKMGAVKMASVTESPIVPFVITGKYRPFRKGLKLEFLEPVKVGEDLLRENEKLMKIISDKLKDGGLNLNEIS